MGRLPDGQSRSRPLVRTRAGFLCARLVRRQEEEAADVEAAALRAIAHIIKADDELRDAMLVQTSGHALEDLFELLRGGGKVSAGRLHEFCDDLLKGGDAADAHEESAIAAFARAVKRHIRSDAEYTKERGGLARVKPAQDDFVTKKQADAAYHVLHKAVRAAEAKRLTARDMTARGTLEVLLEHGTGLPSADSNGLSDPYVVLTMGDGKKTKKHTSKVKEKSLDPVWNEPFKFEGVLEELFAKGLTLRVMDKDPIWSSDDHLGDVVVTLEELKSYPFRTNRYVDVPLKREKDERGTISFRVTWIADPEKASS